MNLTPDQRELLRGARRAVLATIAPDGRPRLVPCAYAFLEANDQLTVYSALDEKPKSVADPHDLARVRDIAHRPQVALLIDRWSEDWSQLAWLRLEGEAQLIEPGGGGAEHDAAVALLRERYAQYLGQRLEHRPLLRINVTRVAAWSAT